MLLAVLLLLVICLVVILVALFMATPAPYGSALKIFAAIAALVLFLVAIGVLKL